MASTQALEALIYVVDFTTALVLSAICAIRTVNTLPRYHITSDLSLSQLRPYLTLISGLNFMPRQFARINTNNDSDG